MLAITNEILQNSRSNQIKSYHVGRGWSFTKRGLGRKHNHTGTERRFKELKFEQEYQERWRIRRFTKNFIRRLDIKFKLHTDNYWKSWIISNLLKLFPKLRHNS